jgi:hypothetical protein
LQDAAKTFYIVNQTTSPYCTCSVFFAHTVGIGAIGAIRRNSAQKGATRRNMAQLGATRRIYKEQKYHMDNGLEFNAKHILGFYQKYQYLVLPDVEQCPEYLRGLKSSRAPKTPHLPAVWFAVCECV